ncbi:MAG: PEP-CTERM sorting domain-containing protein [Proteobacteria bacterium]|nr:PEP-CTERM sorting domain-containing protein [Pseudomonadota bacterium]
MNKRYLGGFLLAGALASASAFAVPVSFTKLTGLTGGSPAGTAVYQADLSALGLGTIASIKISDNSFGLGGSVGQFSGFDLDSIKLSTTDCSAGGAACVAALVGLSAFDFALGVQFTPGAQRAPADAKLFGTGPLGNTLDDAVATLGAFDGNSTTAIPGAAGFISLGDGGSIGFNLTSSVSTAGLFLYIGEVGDNGEVAASNVDIKDTRLVPEPTSLALIGVALCAVGLGRRRGV